MVRRTDRPLQVVRVSFEMTRLSSQLLIDAYASLVPPIRRTQLRSAGGIKKSPSVAEMIVSTRRGKA
jgi:hypothetical protein